MPHGTHVTEAECAEIRRLKARSRWDDLIARKMDVGRSAVYYHASGRCDHPPPPDGLLDSDDDA